MDASGDVLDGVARAAIVESIQSKLHDAYIFPEVGEEMARAIGLRLAAGEYDALSSGDEFAATLTGHLQGISRDKHLRVSHDDEPQPMGDEARPGPAQRAHW